MPHIFISYAKKDTRQLAFALDDALNALDGVTSWVDRSMKAGRSWEMQIETEIDKCDFMVVLYSEDLHRHKKGEPESYVLTEIDYAKRTAKKMIIPVMAQQTYAPIMLTREQYIDYVGNGMDVAMLVEALCYEMNITMQPRTGYTTPPKIETPSAPKIIAPKKPTSLDLMPKPFDWITIPAGKVTLEAGGYLKQATTFDVPTFQIAKYPTTNAQFDVFINHPDGYKNPGWWDFSPDAKKWRADNQNPQNTGFAGDTMPRTNVSWYESVAFCRWLSAMTGEKIMLPTEQHWQRAAQGDDGRDYPWGNEWDKSRCNNNSQGTTPVTQYEGKGDSPYKVVDMAGNVWEWCATAYNEGENNLQGTDVRMLRGGSWSDGSTDSCRAVDRDWGTPHGGLYNWGFRFARFS